MIPANEQVEFDAYFAKIRRPVKGFDARPPTRKQAEQSFLWDVKGRYPRGFFHGGSRRTRNTRKRRKSRSFRR